LSESELKKPVDCKTSSLQRIFKLFVPANQTSIVSHSPALLFLSTLQSPRGLQQLSSCSSPSIQSIKCSQRSRIINSHASIRSLFDVPFCSIRTTPLTPNISDSSRNLFSILNSSRHSAVASAGLIAQAPAKSLLTSIFDRG
jgi:hypothetical protein